MKTLKCDLCDATDEDIEIEVFWATDPSENGQSGAAFFAFNVPSGTDPGNYGPERILNTALSDSPDGISHIVANADSNIGSVSDVDITYGANARRNAVANNLVEIIQDGQRQAGDDNVTITSTARTANDQARIMYANMVRFATLQAGIDSQRRVYRAPGQAVITVFENETIGRGLTLAQAIANSAAIRAAMETEIIAQGCENVSRHCADPAVQSVVDIADSTFANATALARFRAELGGAPVRILIENEVTHVEYTLP